MNARLSALLVAGGMVFAAHTHVAAHSPIWEEGSIDRPGVLESVTISQEEGGKGLVRLMVPGWKGNPTTQVLANPTRLVVDLPSVDRGQTLSPKAFSALTHPLILKKRLAQFSTEPTPITRCVLELAPGTHAEVTNREGQVEIRLEGASKARGEAKVQVTSARIEPVRADAVATTSILPEGLTPTIQARTTAMVPDGPGVSRAAALSTLPSIGTHFQSLPILAGSVLAASQPAMPQATQEPLRPTVKTLGDAPPKYTGALMTLDIQNMSLGDFLRQLAYISNQNVISDPEVEKVTVNFKFKDLPWDQVLDIVCKQANLGKVVENGLIRVASNKQLREEEEAAKQLTEARALAGELKTITRPLSYAKVSEAQVIIEKLMSPRGKLIIDGRTNTLFLTDLPQRLPVVEELINTLDVPIQQVSIDAKIVEANVAVNQAFGVKWPTTNAGGGADLSINGTAAPWVASDGKSWNGVNNRSTGGNTAMVGFAPGVSSVTGIAGAAGEMWLSFLTPRFNVNVILQALQSEGKLKSVSNPKITTFNNPQGTISSGKKIPYPSQPGRPAGECLFIDDSPANVAAAQALGFDTIRFQSPAGLESELKNRKLLA